VKHPGTITFVDGLTGETTSVAPVEEIDPSLRFLPGADGGLRPVVRVEITTEGDHRTLREFGPGDELLRSTFQTRE
jgi:hypothetical protein